MTTIITRLRLLLIGPCLAILCFFSISCSKSSSSNLPGSPTDTMVVAVPPPSLATVRSWLVDKSATDQTTALFYSMKKIAKTNILFGHQDDTKRGYGWANEEGQTYQPLKSDVKDVSGAYPAIYGWDFHFITGKGTGSWFDYERARSHDLAVDAYNRGGINTFCWHYENPVSGGSFYWTNSAVEAVSKIIPGGAYNDSFKIDLKKIAIFAKALTGADGNLIPIIFRPFHEFDGDWFWWGAAHCSADQYKTLYQFTVTYLRDSLGVRNFLYAWSPDRTYNTQSDYLQRYPGNAYVDIVGSDNYEDLKAGVALNIAAAKLKIVSDFAIANNKVAALTETGSTDNLSKSDWFTQTLLKVLQFEPLQLAYALTWDNTIDNFYTPYKGHPAETDFVLFKNSSYFIFGDGVQDVYKIR